MCAANDAILMSVTSPHNFNGSVYFFLHPNRCKSHLRHIPHLLWKRINMIIAVRLIQGKAATQILSIGCNLDAIEETERERERDRDGGLLPEFQKEETINTTSAIAHKRAFRSRIHDPIDP